jgi:hypothetical protein
MTARKLRLESGRDRLDACRALVCVHVSPERGTELRLTVEQLDHERFFQTFSHTGALYDAIYAL